MLLVLCSLLSINSYSNANTNIPQDPVNPKQGSAKQDASWRIKELLADKTTVLTDDLINNISSISTPQSDKLKAQLRDLEKGTINVDDIDKDLYDFTLLHKVILRMSTPRLTSECDRVVTILLNKGANPNIRDAHGRTPLEIAINNESVSIVGVLVAKGAALSEKTSNGYTLIEEARSHYDMVCANKNDDPVRAKAYHDILQILQKAQ